LLFVFAILGVVLLYVQFKIFLMVVGAFILVFFSPFMSIFYGIMAYVTRPWPSKTPEQFGMTVEFDTDFMSVTANAHELRKSKTKVAHST
jgi:ABC-type bacteriocin/lantibiotic exporter with double-glycine peptidase domain